MTVTDIHLFLPTLAATGRYLHRPRVWHAQEDDPTVRLLPFPAAPLPCSFASTDGSKADPDVRIIRSLSPRILQNVPAARRHRRHHRRPSSPHTHHPLLQARPVIDCRTWTHYRAHGTSHALSGPRSLDACKAQRRCRHSHLGCAADATLPEEQKWLLALAKDPKNDPASKRTRLSFPYIGRWAS